MAVGKKALTVQSNGSFEITDPRQLGLSATLSRGISPDATNSLTALVDRQLRDLVVAANHADPALVRSNLDGTGHSYYVDAKAGFTPRQQRDLINFLMALDDNPGQY